MLTQGVSNLAASMIRSIESGKALHAVKFLLPPDERLGWFGAVTSFAGRISEHMAAVFCVDLLRIGWRVMTESLPTVVHHIALEPLLLRQGVEIAIMLVALAVLYVLLPRIWRGWAPMFEEKGRRHDMHPVTTTVLFFGLGFVFGVGASALLHRASRRS